MYIFRAADTSPNPLFLLKNHFCHTEYLLLWGPRPGLLHLFLPPHCGAPVLWDSSVQVHQPRLRLSVGASGLHSVQCDHFLAEPPYLQPQEPGGKKLYSDCWGNRSVPAGKRKLCVSAQERENVSLKEKDAYRHKAFGEIEFQLCLTICLDFEVNKLPPKKRGGGWGEKSLMYRFLSRSPLQDNQRETFIALS